MGKIVSAAIIVCIINVVLKGQRPEYAVALSFISAALVLIWSVPYIMEIAERARDFAFKIDVESGYIASAIKVCGISCITQIACEICRDAGEGALAQNVELAGKGIMLYAALPAIDALFSAIEGVII